MTVTNDFSQFGQREREEARKLLSTYGTNNDKTTMLGEGVQVYFNTYSGYVFLSDEDYNVAIMHGSELRDFITCPECGHESVDCEFEEYANDCCKEYKRDIA